MKWTYDWLKDYLDTDAGVVEIADKLTEIGLEVEDVAVPIVPVAARVIECEIIPDTHLHKLTVDCGEATPRQIVCGAPNVRAGLISALALPGCKIGDMLIKSGKIRGIESHGMMCSAQELGISDDHSGIIELPENSEIGAQLKTADAVFDAGITPNRPDYLAVIGIARDLAAAGIGKLKIENGKLKITNDKSGTRKARIENNVACPVYRLCEIHGLNMAPSNPTIAGRLSAIGSNPKNAAIDATNYICYDIGQPMHCFDADEIHGDIIIRNADIGEKFTDLFGAEHELIDTDLVIADSDGILALAGVVGGARGMTTDNTKNIILESAYFEPVGIRKTAKRLGLSTDSSYRYERGINPTITGDAIAMAAEIIMEACGGEIVGSFVAGENPPETRRIPYSPDLFKKKTGIDLAPGVQKEILEKLGFAVNINDKNWIVIPTPARVDVEIPENIVSELIRIYGYENIKSKKHESVSANIKSQIINIKSRLAALGLTESVSYGFGDSEKEKLLSDRPNIKIKNPIVSNFDTARNGLIQNMLDIIANNDRFKRTNLNLFELGTVFDGDMPNEQHQQLVIARTGIAGPNIGAKHGRNVEIYDVREDLLALISNEKLAISNDDNPPKWANPFRAGKITITGKPFAQFAELHPMIAKKFGIKTRVVLGIVDDVKVIPELSATRESKITNHKSVNDFPEFPLITRDFAFIVDNNVSPDDMVKAIKDSNPIIYDTNVFDVFDLGNAKKSVAFEIVIQPTSNMSDTDLLDLQNKIIAETEKLFDAKIRDK
ncbi:MAG: phenylalanine--tRNA ligase subunit beta [Alphaproteobacteria bacterium]|nr:phenylalanine--tRNA ligase subunit beta [Alphaproteobacteria bacterium]